MIKKITYISLLILIIIFVGYYFFPEKKLPPNTKITKIIVLKSQRKLLVYSDNQLVKTYKIALGRNPVGAKEFEGDGKTPEGIFKINYKSESVSYHKKLGISYPNKENIEYAKQFGKSAGGDVLIHGLHKKMKFTGKFHRFKDWTLGCIALTNNEIDEIYNNIVIGSTIEIKP